MLRGSSARNVEYDAAGNRTQLAAQIGGVDDFVNDYVYDALSRMTRVTQSGVQGGNTVVSKRVDFGYLRDGSFKSIHRYANLSGTQLVAQSDFTYDPTGRLSGLVHKKGATTFADYGFAYDAANRLETFTNSIHTAENATYTYDFRGQLTGVDYTSQTDESYTYDENGNRNNGGFSPGDNNQLVSDGVYDYYYDYEGNITQRTKISDNSYTVYEWDPRNRLVKVIDKISTNQELSRVEYLYDAFDRLIGRKVFLNGSGTASESQHFIYDGTQIVLTLEDGGDVQNRYLWGPAVDQLLAQEDGYGTVNWALTDHLGTPRDWVDSSGTLVEHAEYDSFGRRLDTATIDAAFEWTGRYRDPLTGLQYNNARWYNPDIQRWMSEDPIGFAGGDANLARYVGNAPPTRIDPTGLFDGPIDIDSLNAAQDAARKRAADARKRAQDRLDYLRALLKEVVWLSSNLADNKTQIQGYDLGNCNLAAGFNADEWRILKDHIVYANNKYPNVGFGGVGLSDGSSMNNPLWPGITLDEEAFYGNDFGAIQVLIHEPMHNLTRQGLFHDIAYFDGFTINEIVGPYSDDNMLQRLYDFFRKSTCGNESLWKQIQRNARDRLDKQAH